MLAKMARPVLTRPSPAVGWITKSRRHGDARWMYSYWTMDPCWFLTIKLASSTAYRIPDKSNKICIHAQLSLYPYFPIYLYTFTLIYLFYPHSHSSLTQIFR